ncbi:hypothetical protein [Phaffia rhodozyma]|uniref:Uncharacterized protein n=1 Tax=Phaffia rhodozyma TaxID=264483 RepID=A0A0F7SMY6_PHARH|nr:hypothetical protein [Phaffia rhodozyma]
MPTVSRPNSSLSRFSSWSRFLALQILQVTSLSITFSLSYDTALPSILSPSLQSSHSSSQQALVPRPASSATASAVNQKGSRGRRKKKHDKAGSPHPTSAHPAISAAPHLTAQAANSIFSDTEGEEGDENENESSVNEQDQLGSNQHLHYPEPSGYLKMAAGADLLEGSSPASGLEGRTHLAVLMSRGLAVTVNGNPWRSVAAHVIDDGDEAIVVVYGLSPGEEYTVELGLIPDEDSKSGGEYPTAWTTTTTLAQSESSSSSIPTAASNSKYTTSALSSIASPNSTVRSRSRSRANSFRRSRASSSASAQPPSLPELPPVLSTSPVNNSSIPASPSTNTSLPSTSSLSVEALTSMFKHLLTQSQTQQAILSTELKSQRRSSQKNEAQLRSSIQALQRTLEKNSAGDLRGRQKVLALGEAVKRLTVGKEDVDLERKALEEEIWGEQVNEGEDPTTKKTGMGLERKEEEKIEDWKAVERDGAEMEKERNQIVGSNERVLAEWETEMNGLISKLEKLNGKQERLRSQADMLQNRLETVSKERAEIINGTHPVLLDAAATSTIATITTNMNNANNQAGFSNTQTTPRLRNDRERTSLEHVSASGQAFRANVRPMNPSGGRGIGNGYGPPVIGPVAPPVTSLGPSVSAPSISTAKTYRPFGTGSTGNLPQLSQQHPFPISSTSAINSSQATVPPFRPHGPPQTYQFNHSSTPFGLHPPHNNTTSGSNSQSSLSSLGEASNGFPATLNVHGRRRVSGPDNQGTFNPNPNESQPPFTLNGHPSSGTAPIAVSSALNSASNATFPPLPSQREGHSPSPSPSISHAQLHHSPSLADIVTKGATSAGSTHQHHHLYHLYPNPKSNQHHPFSTKSSPSVPKVSPSPPPSMTANATTAFPINRVQQAQEDFPPLSPVMSTNPPSRRQSSSSAIEALLPTGPVMESR